MSLGVAVIGAGVVGARRAACAADRGRVVVVADIDGERAAGLAARHGASHTTRWEDAVSDSAVDVVAVCTNNKFLAPISIAALRAGKHVLCEKPMGRNLSEAEAIALAAERTDRIFKVGFTLRFHPALRRAHELCAGGEIGPVFFFQAEYGHGGRHGYDKEWRADPDLAGGGELLDQGVHLLDLARWFLGDLDVVAAVTPRWYWDIAPLEDNALVLLEGRRGEAASLHTSWTMWKNRFRFEVVGRDGYIRVDGLGGSYGAETLTIGHKKSVGAVPEESVFGYESSDASFSKDWEDLVRAIEGRGVPEVGAEAGLSVMRLVDDVYARASVGNPASSSYPSSP